MMGRIKKENISKTKDVVAGLGEIGKSIFQLISKGTPAISYDINPKLIDKKNYKNQKLGNKIINYLLFFFAAFFFFAILTSFYKIYRINLFKYFSQQLKGL